MGQPKKYVLSMFPYPSGSLHMGHVRVYSISDTMARFWSMNGMYVIHPIGWDAFGLPAENAAKHHKLNPKEWTYSNIATMKKQLQEFGCRFDWNREFATCDPAYYRWTQHLFLMLYDRGLAYQKHAKVFYDPVDKTVLAKEQIDSEGRSWRSGAKVSERHLKQWFLKCSRFSESLLGNLDSLKDWDNVTAIQKNWIQDCDLTEIILKSADGKQTLSVILDNVEALPTLSSVVLDETHSIWRQNGATRELEFLNPLTSVPIAVRVGGAVSFEFDAHGSDLERCEIFSKLKENGTEYYRISSKLWDDWVVSRQRFWGTPIPVVHCESCGAVPVPFDQLPVILPDLAEIPTGAGEASPLSLVPEWCNTACPRCKGPAKRETDTLDTFFDSSWYFLRYLDPINESQIFDPQLINPLMPVDIYVGGIEHALLHLFYARFISHFLHGEGLLKCQEPFGRFLAQGMVNGETLVNARTGEYLARDDVITLKDGSTTVTRSTTDPVEVKWDKMSKSKFNGVDPRTVIAAHGSDMTRLLLMYAANPRSELNWTDRDLSGLLKWLGRTVSLVKDFCQAKSSGAVENTRFLGKNDSAKDLEKTINNVYNYSVRHITYHMAESYLSRTCIAKFHSMVKNLMKYPQDVYLTSRAYERCLLSMIIMLHPFAPHLSAELWSCIVEYCGDSLTCGYLWNMQGNVWDQTWPVLDVDTKFDLYFMVDDKAYGQSLFDGRLLDGLSVEQAMGYGSFVKRLQTKLKDRDIVNTELKKMKNFGAYVYITTEERHNFFFDMMDLVHAP